MLFVIKFQLIFLLLYFYCIFEKINLYFILLLHIKQYLSNNINYN